MNSLDLIDILYKKLSDDRMTDRENHERISGKANKDLEEKVIKPLIKQKYIPDAETIISAALDKENRFYFELGFKCAMQLRNVGELEVHHG